MLAGGDMVADQAAMAEEGHVLVLGEFFEGGFGLVGFASEASGFGGEEEDEGGFAQKFAGAVGLGLGGLGVAGGERHDAAIGGDFAEVFAAAAAPVSEAAGGAAEVEKDA